MSNRTRSIFIPLVLGLFIQGCNLRARGSKEFLYQGKPIHPAFVQELSCNIADPLPVVSAVDLEGCSRSNRYFGRTFHEVRGFLRCAADPDPSLSNPVFFEYRALGVTSSGVHILETAECTGGTGIFMDLLFVRLRADRVLDQAIERKRTSLACVGSFGLGDRDDGTVRLDGDRVLISASRYRPEETVLTIR